MKSNGQRPLLRVGVIVALTISVVSPALLAQGRTAPRGERQGLPPPPGAERPVSPGEIQQMFDAYVVMQAQDVLKLNENQYPRFITRLRNLQQIRRRGENQRMMLLNQLRRLVNDPEGRFDEAMVKERLKMLEDLRVSVAADVKQAQDSLDEVLDLRQQARFRVFEEEMERRKVELVMRTRQANRPARDR
jgi:hypothetical protein